MVVVVLENKAQREVLGNRAAPYFNALAARSAVLTRYGGVAHPSLPNYLALVSGSTHGIKSDCTACVLDAENLADTLEGANLTWKAYAEGLPWPGFTGARAGRYVKRHVPFLYFRDIVRSPSRRRRVVPLRQLSRDLAAGELPSFSRAPVPAIAAGPLVKPGSRFTVRSSHFALLRTIEDGWGLRRLGRSREAVQITGIWK